jgi:hypothetical protein
MFVEGGPANLIQGEGPDQAGTYRAARLGVENRSCTSSGSTCFVSGLDLGVRHFDQHDVMSSDPGRSLTGAQAALQLGLDVGGRVRFRPALEGLLDLGRDHGSHMLLDGLVITMSLGYQR